jgi:DNA repair exonuclease SbcCD ATPase subunit
MPAPVIQAIGYILGVIFAGVALYYWRRATSLYSLLVEGANRFEEIRQRNQLLETTLSKAETKFSMHKDQLNRLEKSGDEARNRAADLLKKLEAREHEARLNSEKFELQRNYFEKQLQKFQEQFKSSEESKAQIESALAKSSKDLQMQSTVVVEEQKLAIKNLELKLRDKEQELVEVESKMKQTDPEELRKLRRRIAQYERLYGSMRGLKEMTEERNRNWEVALRKLSNWILSQRGLSEHEIPKTIGPMVAEALQAIGTQLIDDSELDLEQQGASSSDSMDFSDLDANDLEAKLVAESARFSYNDPALEALNNLDKTEREKT